MKPGEHLFAFLNDVRVVSPPRSHPSDVRRVGREDGVGCWHQAARQEDQCVEQGVDVLPDVVDLSGGPRQFVHEKVTERVEEERRLWESIPHVGPPDRAATTCCTLYHQPVKGISRRARC